MHAMPLQLMQALNGPTILSGSGVAEYRRGLVQSQKYQFSETLFEYFCGTCFTFMFLKRNTPGAKPDVSTGTLNNDVPNLVEYANHIFVGDTRDGGASMWLRTSWKDGRPLPRWDTWHDARVAGSKELPMDWPGLPDPLSHSKLVEPGTTPFYCHCRGVNFLVRSARDMDHRPKEDLPPFVDPKTYRYLALTCVCDWCRSSSGVDVPNWAFADLAHIEFPPSDTSSDSTGASQPFPASVSELKEAVSSSNKDSRLGTLTFYQTSPDVQRYFCSRCAATVFYAVGRRPHVADFAVGLLDHPSGARAEGLLSWDYGRMVSATDTEGGWRNKIVTTARKECEEWRVMRGYPQGWPRVLG